MINKIIKKYNHHNFNTKCRKYVSAKRCQVNKCIKNVYKNKLIIESKILIYYLL